MARGKSKEFLVFVDTCVLLNFYKSSGEAGLKRLQRLETIEKRLVITYQIEMEFKKNRQKVLIEGLNELKEPKHQWQVPSIFQDSSQLAAAKRKFTEVSEHLKKLQARALKALANPTQNDPVYQSVQRLFRSDHILSLRVSSETEPEIRERAERRFLQGYPPRKKADTSFGDALNWEWLVECSRCQKANAIIVSCDSDYGAVLKNTCYINDWLLQEFRERVSRKKEVILTNTLSSALKMVGVPVSKAEEQEEELTLKPKPSRMRLFIGGGDVSTGGSPEEMDANILELENIVEQLKRRELLIEDELKRRTQEGKDGV